MERSARSAARDTELREEVLRALRVHAEVDVGRLAGAVARDRGRGDRVRRADEVRSARVAEARAARTDRRVLRQAKPTARQGVEERRGIAAEAVEGEGRLATTHLPVAVAVP